MTTRMIDWTTEAGLNVLTLLAGLCWIEFLALLQPVETSIVVVEGQGGMPIEL